MSENSASNQSLTGQQAPTSKGRKTPGKFNIEFDEPYGVIPVEFAKELYNSRNYKELMFALYVDARRRCKGGKYDFHIADIHAQAGIDQRMATKIAQAYVEAGIFSAQGRTPKGSRKFHLNHQAFGRYLKGKLRVKVRNVVRAACIAQCAHQQQESPVNTGVSEKDPENQPQATYARCAPQLRTDLHFAAHTVRTKISEKKSEEERGLFSKPNPVQESKAVRVTYTEEELDRIFFKHFGKKKGESSSQEKTGSPPRLDNSASSSAPGPAPTSSFHPFVATIQNPSLPVQGNQPKTTGSEPMAIEKEAA